MKAGKRLTDAALLRELIARGCRTPADCAQLGQNLGLRPAAVRLKHQSTEEHPGIWAAGVQLLRRPAGATSRELVRRLLEIFPDRSEVGVRSIVLQCLHVLRLLSGGGRVAPAEYRFRIEVNIKRGVVHYADGSRDPGRDSIQADLARMIGRRGGASSNEMIKALRAARRKDYSALVRSTVSIWRSIIADGETAATFSIELGQSARYPVFRVR